MSYQPFAFSNPLKTQLEHLLSVQGDIHRAKRSLERLRDTPAPFQLSGEIATGLYTQALVSYARSFTSGRRKGISRDIFDLSSEMLELHDEFKKIRDRHIAHAVGDRERFDILLAASEAGATPVGMGIHNWFLVGPDPAELDRFISLVRFVDAFVAKKIVELGNQLAQAIIGPRATWSSAQLKFWSHITREQIYGPTPDPA